MREKLTTLHHYEEDSIYMDYGTLQYISILRMFLLKIKSFCEKLRV